MTAPTFLKLSDMLEFLGQDGWMPPETRAQASVRILQALANLPSWEWKNLHFQVAVWYDKCREQLEKSQELLLYPELLSRPMTVEEVFLKEDQTSAVYRVMELLVQDYTLTGKRLMAILETEGRKTNYSVISRWTKAAKALLCILHNQGTLDLNKLYSKEKTP